MKKQILKRKLSIIGLLLVLWLVITLSAGCNAIQERQNEKDFLWELTAITTNESRQVEYLCTLANFESETLKACLKIQDIFNSLRKNENDASYEKAFFILNRAALETRNERFFEFYITFYPGEYLSEIKSDTIFEFAAKFPDVFFKIENPGEVLDCFSGQSFFSTKEEGEFLCNRFEIYGKDTKHIYYELAREYAAIIRNILNDEFPDR